MMMMMMLMMIMVHNIEQIAMLRGALPVPEYGMGDSFGSVGHGANKRATSMRACKQVMRFPVGARSSREFVHVDM
eukprot:3602813-Amphidinium_carterae.1